MVRCQRIWVKNLAIASIVAAAAFHWDPHWTPLHPLHNDCHICEHALLCNHKAN